MPNQPLMTATQIADRISVDVQTIWRWRRAGRMPNAIMLGTKSRPTYRWDTDAIDTWISAIYSLASPSETEAGQ